MAWIETVPEDQATGKLQEVYARRGRARGGVSEVMKVHSLHPEAMAAHLELYLEIMFGRSPLPRPLREAVGAYVSALNACRYCWAHHSAPLRRYRVSEAALEALARGEVAATGFPEAWQAALRHAEKLTRRPEAVQEADLEALRAAGWDDRAILDLTLIVGYFNFVNRVVMGLGAELEPDFLRTTGELGGSV